MIGLENLRHSRDQSDARLKPMFTLVFMGVFPRSRCLLVFTLGSMLHVTFSSVLIGRSHRCLWFVQPHKINFILLKCVPFLIDIYRFTKNLGKITWHR